MWPHRRASAEADLAAAEAAVDASVESFQAAQKAVDKVKAECKPKVGSKTASPRNELLKDPRFSGFKKMLNRPPQNARKLKYSIRPEN